MSHFHTFQRPEVVIIGPQVGEPYNAHYTRYPEGARFLYSQGAYELTLFWSAPTRHEIEGFRAQPIEVGLYTNGPAAFLLYRIQNVCEWSDLAFNVHRVPEPRALPTEPAGERARLRLFLVNADDGLVAARRLVSLDKVMTQALRHTLQEQARQPFDRTLYDAAVQDTHSRFADSDALLQAAEVVEATLG